MSIRSRIEAIEAVTAPRAFYEIIVAGGLPDAPSFDRATWGGDFCARRDAGEGEEAFRARARSLAKDAGALSVVFGGLPSDE